MGLSQQLGEYVRACFTGLWIESHEHADAITEIAALCREEDRRLATWDIEAVLPFRPSNTCRCRWPGSLGGDPVGQRPGC